MTQAIDRDVVNAVDNILKFGQGCISIGSSRRRNLKQTDWIGVRNVFKFFI